MKRFFAAMVMLVLFFCETACSFSANTEKPKKNGPYPVFAVDSVAAFQGGFIAVRADGFSDNSAILRCAFAGKDYGFFRVSGCFVCIVPLPFKTKKGVFPVIVFSDNTIVFSDNVVVAAKKFPSYKLGKFKPLPKKILTVIEKEKVAVKRAFSGGAKKSYFENSGWFALSLSEIEETSSYGTKRIFSNFAYHHAGVDLKASVGTDVFAANDGRVVYAKENYMEGKLLIIDHGAGIFSVYMHLSKFLVKKGDFVRKGQPVAMTGKSGRTRGPHLHFGIKINGIYIDPLLFIKIANDLKPRP